MEQNPSNLYEAHWARYSLDATALIRDRFTIEAFSRINRFVTDADHRILEVACGTGRFCALLAQGHALAKITGVDISRGALDIAWRLRQAIGCRNVSLVESSVFQLPFANSQFDVVLCEGLISQFRMDGHPPGTDALLEMVRVAKPGGKVLVSEPNWNCFPHTIYKWLKRRLKSPYEYGYEKSFKSRELFRLFEHLGLRNIELTGFYPAYGFYRLGRYSRLLRAAGKVIDRIDNEWCSRSFGFHIIVKGNK